MLFNNLLFIVYGLLSFSIIFFVMIVSLLLGGRTQNLRSSTVYECGFLPYRDILLFDSSVVKVFSLFLLFDLEAVITLPIISLFSLEENLIYFSVALFVFPVLFTFAITICFEVWGGLLEIKQW